MINLVKTTTGKKKLFTAQDFDKNYTTSNAPRRINLTKKAK